MYWRNLAIWILLCNHVSLLCPACHDSKYQNFWNHSATLFNLHKVLENLCFTRVQQFSVLGRSPKTKPSEGNRLRSRKSSNTMQYRAGWLVGLVWLGLVWLGLVGWFVCWLVLWSPPFQKHQTRLKAIWLASAAFCQCHRRRGSCKGQTLIFWMLNNQKIEWWICSLCHYPIQRREAPFV